MCGIRCLSMEASNLFILHRFHVRRMLLISLTAIYACIWEFSHVDAKSLQHGGSYPLAAIGGSGINERTFQRRWRLSTKLERGVENAIMQELARIVSQLPKDSHSYVKDTGLLKREARRIRDIILPERQDIFLNKYRAIEKVGDRGFLGDILKRLFEDDGNITFSAWQYRPNVLQKGGNLTLEIHYRVPLNIGCDQECLFEPIVVYTCNVSPGKYVPGAAIFSTGTVEVLTHALIPWRKFRAGTVDITPPRMPTLFNS